MPQGTIKRLVRDRGFGFISGARDDVFFHSSAVRDLRFEDLVEGQVVDYEVESGGRSQGGGGGKGKGPRATMVKASGS
jgi:CspA family cold shock protein